MMVRKIYFLCFSIFIFTIGFSQDPLFTNTSQSLVYLNPSFAGSNGFLRKQGLYRNQWANLPSNYITCFGGTEFYIKPLKAGVSFTYMHDNQARGTLKSNMFSLIYAQHFYLLKGKLKIIPSIKAMYFNKILDRAKLHFGDEIDPRRGFVWNTQEAVPSQKKRNFDVSAGLLINYNNFYFGTSIFHINQPDEGLLGTSKLPYRLSFHSSYNLHLSEKTLINIFGRYEQQQNFYFYQVAVNAVLFNHLILGVGYMHKATPLANIGFRHNYFTLQASYGISTSVTSNKTAPTWEGSLSINIRNKEQRKTLTDFEKW